MHPDMGTTPKSRARYFRAFPDVFIDNQTAFVNGLATEHTPLVTYCEHCDSPLLTWGIMGLQAFGMEKPGTLWNPAPERCDCAASANFWKRHDQSTELERRELERQLQEQAKRRQLDYLLSQAGLVDRYVGCTLSSFRITSVDQSIQTAAAKANGFVEYFDRVQASGKGLYLTGTFGSGKTHLAAGIALEICKKMRPVIMLNMIELLARLRATFDQENRDSEAALMSMFTQVDLLVIDDLGKESPSEWTLEKLYQIINARYERKKPVIITTNYSDKELLDRLAKADGYGGYKLDKKTAGAIISRLHEMCSLTVMMGADWRGKTA